MVWPYFAHKMARMKLVLLASILPAYNDNLRKITKDTVIFMSFFLRKIPGKINLTVSTAREKIKFLEHVILSVKIDFEPIKRGRIEIYLTSPMSTTVNMLHRRPYDNFETKLEWSFMSLYHWEEDPNGNWTVEFKVSERQKPGSI